MDKSPSAGGSAPTAQGENPQNHQPQGQLTKQLDVNLLQRVDTAELVQLVVDLVEDESLVIVSCVVLHDVVHWERRERRDGGGREGKWGKEAEHSQGKPRSSVPAQGL